MLNPRHDIAALLSALTPLTPSETLEASGPAQTVPVDVLDRSSPDVGGDLDVAAVMDGIQHHRVLNYRDHRPIVASFVAAGAVHPDTGDPIALDERLALHCSQRDLPWLTRTTNTSIPIEPVATVDPREAGAAVAEQIARLRQAAETRLVRRLLPPLSQDTYVVVDGSLRPHAVDRRCVGVVKSTATRYLPDEHDDVQRLGEGQVSRRFRTPYAVSAYLRLTHTEQRPWDHGLVRLETYSPGLIPKLASWSLGHRQPPGSDDPRADRHLAPVAACERFLRSRVPAMFDLHW